MTSGTEQRPESSRRRIVVPLGQASGNAPARYPSRPVTPLPRPLRRSRARRVLTIIALLLIVLVLLAAGGGFLWWQYYQATPAYSLALLVDAAQHNDLPGVDKIVDTDKIVDNFATQVSDKAAGRYGGALSGEVSKAIRVRMPALLPIIKQQVRDAVALRVKEISVNADQRPFFVIAAAIPYFVKITTIGDKASAIADIRDRQIRMDLERSGDVWRVVAMQDEALVQRLVDEFIKELPSIGQGIDSDIRKS